MTSVDAAFCTRANALIAHLVHDGAFHPLTAARPARALGEALDTPERIEYACWVLACTCRVAAASIGTVRVNVVAGIHDEHGNLVEAPDIDDAAPSDRAAVRYLRCATAGDFDTAHAVFLTVPLTDLHKIMGSIVRTTIEVVRTTGWGAHQ